MGAASYEDLSLGERIQAARMARGFGLRQVASLAGMSPATLSRAENDKGSLLARHMVPLADALGVTLDWLLRGQGNVLDAAQRARVEAKAMLRTMLEKL